MMTRSLSTCVRISRRWAIAALVLMVSGPGCGNAPKSANGEGAGDSLASGGQGATSSGSDNGGQSGTASGDTSNGTGNAGLSSTSVGIESDGDFFITAVVDGVERRMTTHLYGAVIPDLAPEQIAMAAKDDPTAIQQIWQLQFEHVAGDQEHAIVRYQLRDFVGISAWQLHPITVHLDATAPNLGDVLEGTFEGILITDSATDTTVEVTDGQFRVRRVTPD